MGVCPTAVAEWCNPEYNKYTVACKRLITAGIVDASSIPTKTVSSIAVVLAAVLDPGDGFLKIILNVANHQLCG